MSFDVFGNSSNSNFGLSNMYSNLSGTWSDFSMINSGSYKRLLKSYYSTVKEADSDSSTSSSKTSSSQRYTIKSATELDAEKSGKSYRETVDTAEYSAIKTSAQSLSNAVSALSSEKLYQEPEEEETTTGTTTQKKDVTSSVKSALKDYVNAYNSYMSSARQSNSNSVQAKNLKMFQANAENAKALKDLGITTDKNGKLVFDESKFDSTKVDTVKELFSGKDGYGDEMKKVADETYRFANSVINGGSGSSYSTSGAYSVLGTTNSVLDQLL
ncbi:MAG: hypothetical protein K2J67_05400 [Lachnospiraceae bacterium]|nr:hypothetical protein [Lachnospiraceae bacterium]